MDGATEPLESRRRSLVRQFRLRVLDGPCQGTVYASTGERATIGTQSAMDLVLDDATMSRFQCEIALEAGVAVVRDLGSRNGTLVDGVTVRVAELHDGAVLTLGQTRVRFELGEERVAIPLSEHTRFGSLVGGSTAMRAVFALLQRAAQTDATLLLRGETGTGKDLAASSVHEEGGRREGPFVVVDCGAIPGGLLESELFGHERGAFTGATTSRVGACEQAHGGTLFLDEVGELSLELQPKLLRVLEGRTVQRVGGTRRMTVDVRIIAATNRDLKQAVNQRRFRADLYYRLAVLEVRLPPLRERLEDLPLLVEHFATSLRLEASGRGDALRSAEFLAELEQHSWPGNVRELRNYVERYAALGQLPGLEEDVGREVQVPLNAAQPLRVAREQWVQALEREYLEQLLKLHGNNVSAAARHAGVDRVYVHRLLARHGLRR